MCGKRSRSPRSLWASLCFLALFLSAPAMLGAEDPGTPKSPPSTYEWPTLKQEPTQLPPELMKRWREYDQQFNSSMLTLEQFLDQVEAFGISFESLPGFMTHLVDSYRASELARIQERAASDKALETALREAQSARQRAERWKLGAIIAGALAAVGWGVAAFQYVF